MIRISLYYLCALLLTLLRLDAQKIEVNAPKDVEVGRPFTISYTITGLGNSKVNISEQPSHDGLELLYGPATSRNSEINYINGRVTSSSSLNYTYTFLATDRGNFKISGLRLELNDGRTLLAPTKSIQAFPETTRQLDVRQGLNPRKQYHYLAIVDKRSVYEQEALPITYKLYAQSNFSLVETREPAYDDFISQNLKADGVTQIVREEYKGHLYNTVEIYKELIYPQKSGRLVIPSNKATIQIPLEADDNPFLGQLIDRTLTTQPISIEVKPLPKSSQPDDFSGAVGQFSVQSNISTQTPKTNEAFSLKYTLKGNGNLKMAKLPEINFPSGLEIYPPTDQIEENPLGQAITSTRTIEYSIIPREIGTYTLPALSLSYFDPQLGQYKKLQTNPQQIEVLPGKVMEEASQIVSTGHHQSPTSPHLLSYRRGTSEPHGLSFVNSWFYPTCYTLLVFFMLLIIVWIKKQQKRKADIWTYEASRANLVARKRLRLAHKYSREGQNDAFYEEALRAMWEYIGNKLMLPSGELNRTIVAEQLAKRGIAQEQIIEWTQTMDTIEFARFAPGTNKQNSLALYNRAANIIAYIENNIQ